MVWMNLLRSSKGGAGLLGVMAKRSSLIRFKNLLDAALHRCTYVVSHPSLLVNHAYAYIPYISSGFAGSKYLHWLGGEAVSNPSHLHHQFHSSSSSTLINLPLPLDHLANKHLLRFCFLQNHLSHRSKRTLKLGNILPRSLYSL